MFKFLKLHHWRQFSNIDIQFHRSLTVLTGANGSGKSTILNLLGKHYGWNVNYVGTPKLDRQTSLLTFLPDIWQKFIRIRRDPGPTTSIGAVGYWEGSQADLTVPKEGSGPLYSVDISPMIQMPGLHIPSHRPVYFYQQVTSIPTRAVSRKEAYLNYSSNFTNRFMGGHDNKTPNVVMKETLISLATYGYGNQVIEPNAEARKTFEGFEDILRLVMPPKIGFERLIIRVPEILFKTKSGEFAIDSVSGGISSILDLAWRIYMFDGSNDAIVVTVDEPENHLHPELQQSLLPNLIAAFPNAQFIIATHNPFMISSVKDSAVYVLNYDDRNKIRSAKLDVIERAGTSNEILRDVLGMPFTMPLWAERTLDEIVSKYSDLDITEEVFRQLRTELVAAGLQRYVADAITSITPQVDPNA